jgi:hypothetical protein
MLLNPRKSPEVSIKVLNELKVKMIFSLGSQCKNIERHLKCVVI